MIQTYLAKPAARTLLTGLSRLCDATLQDIWAAHDLPAQATLVAVGGYGRGELYPQSDVDVLILFDDDLPESERVRFEPLIALLWDVGLPIGHSMRSLSECLTESAQDITIQTNILESRLGRPAIARCWSACKKRWMPRLTPLRSTKPSRLNRKSVMADIPMSPCCLNRI